MSNPWPVELVTPETVFAMAFTLANLTHSWIEARCIAWVTLVLLIRGVVGMQCSCWQYYCGDYDNVTAKRRRVVAFYATEWLKSFLGSVVALQCDGEAQVKQCDGEAQGSCCVL